MNPWILQHFFNPAFVLPGAALISAPIIIHLINRMRYRRVRFAAMEFLLQSQQRNRRRLLLEQLLLLLLRILIIVGLVMLIARLILDPNQLSIFRGAKAHHLVLLDDSGSMRDRWGQTTAFTEALGIVKSLAAEGARRPDTQKFTLLLLSQPEQPLFTQRDVNDLFVSELATKLDNVRCSHRALDPVAGLEAAGRLLAEDKATIKHLHFVSDFRRRDWDEQQALGATIRDLDEAGVAVNLVKTVPERHENLAITELSGALQVAAAGVPLRLTVKVKNFGTQVADNVRLSVLVDGEKLPRSIVFDKIEAGVEETAEFDVVFSIPKKHKIQVLLPADAVAHDNTRHLAVDVPPANAVLVVDGDPQGEDGFYVAAALAADPKVTGFAPLVETPDFLRRHPLEKFQCIYLLNVPELAPDAIQPLTDYVSRGGGLVWFLGDAVKPAFYNDKLYQPGGAGLFPVPLAPARRELPPDDETNPGNDIRFASHPVFERIFGQENPFIETVKIFTYHPPADGWNRDDNVRRDGVATVAVLRNKQPFILEHRYGAGRIVTCLTSAGPSWNNWPMNPSYVLTQLELEQHIARHDRTIERRVVGETIAVDLDPAVYTEDVEIIAPDTTGERITRLKAAPVSEKKRGAGNAKDGRADSASASPEGGSATLAGGAAEEDANGTLANAAPVDGAPADGTRSVPATLGDGSSLRLAAMFRETDAPGIYSVKLLDHNQTPEEQWIAYNVPLEESALELATNEQIQKRIGDDVRVQIQDAGIVNWIKGKDAGQEVRWALLIALVTFLLIEQLLAYRLSYHPKAAGAVA